MADIKEYAGGAAPSTITITINAAAASVTATDLTNWPTGATGPFWIVIDPGQSSEEKIRCATRSGNTINFASGGRGGDGTTATSHNSGAVIQHIFTAEDAREANQHVANTAIDNHSQYLNVLRHDLAARHVPGVVPAGTTTAALSGTTGSGGGAGSFSLSDHTHVFAASTAYVPTTSGFTVGNGSIAGRYLIVGKQLVSLQITFNAGTTSNFTGVWSVGLPPGVTVSGSFYCNALLSQVGAIVLGRALVTGSSIAWVYVPDSSPATVNVNILTNSYPQAWASGDFIQIDGAGIELA